MTQQGYQVAVTGGAPYTADMPYNTSALIRDATPPTITRPSHPPIKILKYPHDVESTYTDVSAVIPQLWAGDLRVYDLSCGPPQTMRIDALLHMGMQQHAANTFFVESTGRRDVFTKPGVDGRMLEEGRAIRMWEGCPVQLSVSWDVDGVVRRVGEACPDTTVVPSNDAGSSFCELQLYGSLAELCKRGKRGIVGFLHVPAGKEEEDIKRGAGVATALITAIVDSLESKGLLAKDNEVVGPHSNH